MKANPIPLIIVTVCFAFTCPSASCYAQGFARSARSALYSIVAAETKGYIDYETNSSVDQQMLRGAWTPIPSVPRNDDFVQFPNELPISTVSEALISKQLHVLDPPIVDSLIISAAAKPSASWPKKGTYPKGAPKRIINKYK